MVLRLSSPARLSAIAAAAAVALYVIFTAVPAARRLDGAVVTRDLDFSWERFASLPGAVIRLWVVAIAVLALAWIASRDGRRSDALRVMALVGLAAGVSRALEESLQAIDPLGHEAERALGSGWYPSGHAATAMSIGLGALIAIPERTLTRWVLLAAAAWPAIAGWALVTDAGHHPSDIAGGMLLATAIAGALVIGRRGEPRHTDPLPWRPLAAGLGVVAIVCAALALFDELRLPHTVLQPALILAATALAALALALALAFDRALAR